MNGAARKSAAPDEVLRPGHVTYPEQRNSTTPGGYPVPEPGRRGLPDQVAGEGMGKGPGMTDGPSDSTSSKAVSETAPDDFQPDVPPDLQVGTVSAPEPPTRSNGEPSADPDLETTNFGAAGDPMESAPEPSPRQDALHLVPGASIARGRYRLLVFHGGAPHLQFWQALDTALDRQVALTFVDPDEIGRAHV